MDNPSVAETIIKGDKNMKSNKMKPSESVRKFVLRTCTLKWHATLWNVFGIIICVIGIVSFCIFGINNDIKTGVLVALACFGWTLIVTPLVNLLIKFVGKMLYKGVISYDVADVKISKNELIKKALETDQFTVENNGDWLDFSLNWKNCFSADILNASVMKSVAIYKKLIKLNDDYTYQELDYESIGDMNLSMQKFTFAKSSFLGHETHKCIEYNLGVNNDTGDVGLNRYELNTLDFTNSVHKWLAENGYKKID